MFRDCYNLKILDLSNFKTNKVYNMSQMFSNCQSLEILNISNFSFEKAYEFTKMFYGCKSLKEVKTPKLKVKNIDEIDYKFKLGLNEKVKINLQKTCICF